MDQAQPKDPPQPPVSALDQLKATSSESESPQNKSPAAPPPTQPDSQSKSSFSIANLTNNKKQEKKSLAEQLKRSFSNTNPKSSKPTSEMTKQLETKSNITQMIKDQKPKGGGGTDTEDGKFYFNFQFIGMYKCSFFRVQLKNLVIHCERSVISESLYNEST